ncbi:MAG TPA: hypothetical protein VMG11_04515 [Steroidobacteraceae bacterium]|nr:hypothetical protein [Steroidobacteraceae bacterium]
MKKLLGRVLCAVAVMTISGAVLAQGLPFKEGPVVDVTAIRTKDGKFLDYWNFLSTSWRREMEEAKKKGLVLSYTVYGATPRSPNDPDLYLVVTYANYAALDGLDEKMLTIDNGIFGSMKQGAEAQAERGAIRTVLGDEIIRELQFK